MRAEFSVLRANPANHRRAKKSSRPSRPITIQWPSPKSSKLQYSSWAWRNRSRPRTPVARKASKSGRWATRRSCCTEASSRHRPKASLSSRTRNPSRRSYRRLHFPMSSSKSMRCREASVILMPLAVLEPLFPRAVASLRTSSINIGKSYRLTRTSAW